MRSQSQEQPKVLSWLDDGAAILLAPLPNTTKQFFATEIVTGLSLLGPDLFFDHRLSRDSCVVGAGHPKGVEPIHALVTDQDILQGVIQSMPNMQFPGDIRRGGMTME